MLMVVFGAGASYDSYPSLRPPTGIFPAEIKLDDLRPPLADQLFSDKEAFAKTVQSFPDCIPIIPFVRHFPRDSSVEKVLESLRAEALNKRRLST